MLLSFPHCYQAELEEVLWGWLFTTHAVKHTPSSAISILPVLGHRVDVADRGNRVKCSFAVEVKVTLITVLMIH